MAARINRGVLLLGGAQGAGWYVGTFDRDVSKKVAGQVVQKFVRWLRKRKEKPQPDLEYVATWELASNRRLHVNLIMAPWKHVHYKILTRKWASLGGGKIGWISRVGVGIGEEAAKSRWTVADYCAKHDQQVKQGRGFCCSKNWPKLPDRHEQKRKAKIAWSYVPRGSPEEANFEWEKSLGWWREAAPGEWASRLGEKDDSFDLVEKRAPPR